jgi:hypothetical protein
MRGTPRDAPTTARGGRFLHIPGHDAQGAHWQGYDWSPWRDLRDIRVARSAALDHPGLDQPGLYRFRVRRRPGLLYIGETGTQISWRLRQHRGAAKHAAGSEPSDTSLPSALGATIAGAWGQERVVEVSWVPLPDLELVDRKGVECELIAAYRAVMGRNPDCQFLGGIRDER